jgi:predicted transposase YdaD
MLQVHDIRQTRVYQEAKEEGIEEERRRSIAKMATLNMPAESIADLLGLDVDYVRKQMANNAAS